MRALIGNNLIPKLKPSDKQYDVRDTKLNGFLIRVNPSGKMFYVCHYKRGRRVNIGRVGVLTPAQARDSALAILSDMAMGTVPKARKKSLTLDEFIHKKYSPWAIQHRKVGAKTVNHINRCFVKPFGNKKLDEFSPVMIDQWRTQRLKDGLSTETVNRDIATFKAALSKAVLWGFIEVNPLEKLKLLKVDRVGKIRYLSVEEEARLREAMKVREERIKKERVSANQWRKERGRELYPDLSNFKFADHIRPMVLLSMNTGLRRGEIYTLYWSNVDLDRAMLTIDGAYAKSGKTRHIPLNAEALNVLKAWKKQSTNYNLVFPNKNGLPFDNLKKGWGALLKIAKIRNFRWHDLRHHFASKLVMASVDLNTVRELLGHSDMTMTLRYAHLAPEHKANAVAKLMDLHCEAL